MHKGLKEPHVLLASSNPRKLLKNLAHVLDQAALDEIEAEVDANVTGLLILGESHLAFALTIPKGEWRQRISRLYYAVYNVKRAVSLKYDGSFSTDSSDHQKIDGLPPNFNNQATYSSKLKNLRDDRNLADYSHLAKESDLLIPCDDVESMANDFITDAKAFLKNLGLQI